MNYHIYSKKSKLQINLELFFKNMMIFMPKVFIQSADNYGKVQDEAIGERL